jgi:hypothetical protein
MAATANVEYVGTLKDKSTLALAVKGDNVQFRFSNGWTVDTVSATTKGKVIEFAATGQAGDKTLAISGEVKGDKADIEVRVGVGQAAQVGTYVLKHKVLVEDRFDGKVADGWTWLRENPQAWRIRDRGLEIRVEPGLADTVKNALLRKSPDRAQGPFAVEVTITFTTRPNNQFEQAGITWYHDGKPAFKLVHEQIDGSTWIIPGKVTAPEKKVQLRLVVNGTKYTAQFRPDAKGEFHDVQTGNLPPPGDDQVSIQCYNGPADAAHWIRFEDFRIVRLP